MSESKEMVKEKSQSNVAVSEKNTYHGSDQDDSEDLAIPRVKLIHKTSEEIDDTNLNVKPGFLIHNISKDIFEQPLSFVPIIKKVCYMRYNSMNKDDPGFDSNFKPMALMYRVDNKEQCWKDKDGHYDFEWINGNKPLANRIISFLSFLPKYPKLSPIIIDFTKTSLKTGKELTSMLKFSTNRKFFLSTTFSENEGTKYPILKINKDGGVDENIQKACDDIVKDFSSSMQKNPPDSPEWEK